MNRADDHPRTDPRIDRYWLLYVVVVAIACALLLAWAWTRPGW
jgi:hypothetical protein